MQYKSNSLRNVPILIVGYNRPDFLKKRLLEVSKMSVKKIYISVDGGLESRSPEMLELLRNAHNYFKDSQEVIISHHKSNLGLTNHISQAVSEVLKENNFLVIVEDDVILSENFYNNMLHGLGVLSTKKVKGLVCAFSPISIKRNKIFKNKWRNTCYFSCWGWACSKEIWQHYSNEIGAIDLDESLKYSKIWKKLSLEQKKVWFARFKKVANNPAYTWDIQMQFISFANNFTNIAPMFRFIGNEGFNDDRAVHTKGRIPWWFANNWINTQQIETFSGTITGYLLELFESYFSIRDRKEPWPLLQIKKVVHSIR